MALNLGSENLGGGDAHLPSFNPVEECYEICKYGSAESFLKFCLCDVSMLCKHE